MNTVSQEDISFGQGHELISILDRCGLTPELAQKVIESRELAQGLVSHMASDRISEQTESASQQIARSIMKNNFIGILEVVWFLGRIFRIEYNEELLERLENIPFQTGDLFDNKDTHLLIPGYPISFRRILKDLWRPAWLWDSSLMTQEIEPRWYLIRKGPLPNSFNLNLSQQVRLLSDQEEVPTLCEAFYAIYLYELIRSKVLFDEVEVRCGGFALKEKSPFTVSIGSVGSPPRFRLSRQGETQKDPHLGLATSWRLPK